MVSIGRVASLLNVLWLISLVNDSFAQSEDQRCKCLCPLLPVNDTLYNNKAVWTLNPADPDSCDCETVLEGKLTSEILDKIDLGKFCLRCQCVFEQRNSTTQKVVIIFVIVVFGLMFAYGLFLQCLDPLINRRRTQYERQVDSTYIDDSMPSTSRGRSGPAAARRVTEAVNRVRKQQERWKGQVSEQRSNIYTKHKILA